MRRPMKRLIENTVFWGLVTAWRLATWPTSRSPSFVNPTTDGVTRPPSALGLTTGSPPSITGIIALNVLAWLFVQGMGSEEALRTSVCQLGLIPGELLRGVPPGTPIPIGQDQLGHMLYCDRVVSNAPHWGAVLTSMFMHGGWF